MDKNIDWTSLPSSEYPRHLSIRGKNLYFLNMMGEILQLDKIDFKPLSRHEKITILKKAFTPKAIKEIHEAIPLLWPDKKDYLRCLNEEKKSNSGLFIGTYVSDVIGPLLNKYSLYEDTIYLIDPILDHRTLRDKHNPYIHPEQYIVITFQYVWLWFELAPWIKSGIVKVIRNYGDFDYALEKECVETAESRFEEFPDLQKLLECEETTGSMGLYIKSFHKEFIYLKMAEVKVKEAILRIPERIDASRVVELLKERKKNQDASPFYFKGIKANQFLTITSGTNYEMGKIVANLTDSHIITDADYRWKEMEIDRGENGENINLWSAFTKSFDTIDLKYLDGLRINETLKLRKDGYLENMRDFLRKAWRECSSNQPLSEDNIESLKSELKGEIQKAERDWKKIDKDLAKWFGGETVLATTASIISGTGQILPALVAVAGAGAVNIAMARKERKELINRLPAGFFLKDI